MVVHLNKWVWGGVFFLLMAWGISNFSPVFDLDEVNGQEVTLKDMENLGSRLRQKVFFWRLNRTAAVPVTEYNLIITNLGHDNIYPPIRMVIDSISASGIEVQNPDGQMDGKNYIEITADKLPNGFLAPGQGVSNVLLNFTNPQKRMFTYTASFYGRMEVQGQNLAAAGVRVLSDLTAQTKVTKVTMREIPSRAGTECVVKLKNTCGDNIYAPIKIAVDSITSVNVVMGDQYGTIDGKPYIILDNEIPGGVLAPNQEISNITLFFTNQNREKFSFTTKVYGYPSYFYDLKDQIEIIVGNLVGGNNNLTIKNLTEEQIAGPIRVKVKSVEIDGVVHTSGLDAMLQSKNGVSNGLPFQWINDSNETVAKGESESIQMAWAVTGQNVSFNFEVEALYNGLPVKSDVQVINGGIQNDSVAKTTTYTVSLTNNGAIGITQPLILVLKNISDSKVSLTNPSGYLNGNPFIEIPLQDGVLSNLETTGASALVFNNPDQSSFTLDFEVQGINVDDIPPVTTHDYSLDGQYTNSDAVINFSASDGSGTGVKHTFYTVNSGQPVIGNSVTFTAEGDYYVKYWSIDNRNNEELQKEILVRIDRTAPITTTDYQYQGNWENHDVTVNFSVADNASGKKETKYILDGADEQTGNSITINTNGEHTLEYWSIDLAGNQENHKTLIVKIDKNAPVTTDDYNNQVAEGNITVILTPNDDISGLKTTKYKINNASAVEGTSIFIVGVGDFNISYWSEDNAGNIEQAKNIVVKLMGAPSIVIVSPIDNFRTNQQTVDIVGNIDDPNATVKVGNITGTVSGNQFEILNVPLNEGEAYYTVQAENTAGLKRTVYVKVIRDTTPPAITITNPEQNSTFASTVINIQGQVQELNSKLYREVPGGTDVQITLDATGNFALTDYPLNEGLNEIIFYAVDDLGNSAKINGTQTKLRVTRDLIPPDVSLETALYNVDNSVKPYSAVPAGGTTLYNQVAKLDLRGVVNDVNATVKITLTGPNKNEEIQLSLDAQGNFSRTGLVFNLAEAQQGVISVVATDKASNYKKIDIKIVKDTTGPEVIVTTPVNGDVTSDPSAKTISGVVRGAARITINGIEVPVANERFEKTGVNIIEGANLFAIIGYDSIGNQTAVNVTLTLDTVVPGQVVITNPPETIHYTNKDRITINGTGESGAKVYINGGAMAVTADVNTSGEFSQTVFLVAGSSNILSLIQKDKANNSSPEKVITVVQDNKLPNISLTSPATNQVDTNNFMISGIVSDDKQLTATVNGEILDQSNNQVVTKDVNIVNGQFNTSAGLPESGFGNYTLKVKATDKAGNVKLVQLAINYIDTTDNNGPDLVISSPSNNSYKNSQNIVVTGNCFDRNGVTELTIALDNDSYVNVAEFNNDGTFSHSFTVSNDGQHMIKVKALDGSDNHNITEVSASFILDTAAPITAPVVSGITPGVDRGNGNYLTNTDLIRIIGSYEPGYKVKAQSNIQSVEALVGSNGIFQLDIKITKDSLQNIDNTIILVGLDLAGNYSTDTSPDLKTTINVTYDGIAPQVISVIPVDGATNVALASPVTINFSESIQLGSLSDNQGNRIYALDPQNVKYDGSITVAGSDNKTYLFKLNNGTQYPDSKLMSINILSGIKDLAGNSLKNNFVSRFTTVDLTPPAVPTIAQVLPGYITNSASVTISGVTEANAQVDVYKNNVSVANAVAGSNGQYSVNVSLAANEINKFVLKSKDASQNQSQPTSEISITQDNVLPTLVSVQPAEASVNIARNSVFEFKFSEKINQSTIINGFTVKGKANRAIEGTITMISNSNNVAEAGFRFSPKNLLLDGEIVKITLSNLIKDKAGNGVDFSSYQNNTKTLMYPVEDIEPPAVPTISSTSATSPTKNTTLTISGSVEPGAFIKVNGGNYTTTETFESDNDTGAFQITIALKPNNNNVIALKAADRAGNQSEPVSITIFCDVLAPELNSIMPRANGLVPSTGIFTMIFSEQIDEQTILNSILLKKETETVKYTFTINDAKTIVTLKASLDTEFPHSIIIKQTLADIAGNTFAQERTINFQANDTRIPPTPTLTSISTGSPTSEDQIIINGFTEASDLPVEALDAQMNLISEQTRVMPDGSGNFVLTVPLVANKLNTINIVSRRPSGNASEPEKLEIVQDNTAPVVTILAPLPTTVIPTDTVNIIARIEEANQISSCLVNGVEKVINIDENGYLNTVLTGITNGMTVNIVAKDSVGNINSAEITLSVNIEDPDQDASVPIISIVFPKDGESIDGKEINVMGTVEDANEISTVTINNIPVSKPTAFPTPASYFQGNVYNLVDGVNQVTVKAWDIKDNMSEKTISINVDIAPPTITINNPENEAVFTESNVQVSGRVTDSNGVSKLILNGDEVQLDNDGNFTISVQLDEGANTLLFEAIDIADNLTQKELIVYYDLIGPEVILLNPADGQTGVPATTAIYATFSERLDPETVTFNTVKLIYIDDLGDEAKEITGSLRIEGKTVSFFPYKFLEPGQIYRLKILSGIKDLVGFPLQAEKQVTFSVDTTITSLSGMVIDPQTGKGVINATVSIMGTDIETKTDEMGNFFIETPNIPGGQQRLFVDGTTAESTENIQYMQNIMSAYIKPNEATSVGEAIYLPRVVSESMVYINGNIEQDVTFNDTITGKTADFTPIPNRFKMHVPAESLEFPNGTVSGTMSACIVSESYLPKKNFPGLSAPVMSAVWFHPFGVKSKQPIHIQLPMPTDRGDTGVAPGDKFLMISYGSESNEWEEVGAAYVSDDCKTLVLEEGKGLTELTVVAFVPVAITGPMEAQLREFKAGYGGSGEEDIFLMEMMLVCMLMAMMHVIDILAWKTVAPGYGDDEKPMPWVSVQMSCDSGVTYTLPPKAWCIHTMFYPIMPSLIVLLACLMLTFPVLPTAYLETPDPSRNGIYEFPITGPVLWHICVGPLWFPAIVGPIYIDSFAFHGNLRYIGPDGQASNNFNTDTWIDVYSELRGLDGSPVRGFAATDAPFSNDPTMSWARSYNQLCYGSAHWYWYTPWRSHGAYANYGEWRSYIRANDGVRIKAQAGAYMAETYLKAPTPSVAMPNGHINNIDLYANLSLGMLNVNAYISREYERDGNIVSQILPYHGICSSSDSSLTLHTGIAMANGDKAPNGGKMYGRVTGTFSMNTNSDTPWTGGPASVTFEASDNGDFGGDHLLYINLKANETSTNPAPEQRPQSGRTTSGRGEYVAPPADTRTPARVTPTAPSDTARKEYSIYCVSTILYDGSTCNANVTYYDFSNWHQTGDLSQLPGSSSENLSESGDTPTITINHLSKVATSVQFNLGSASPGKIVVKFGQTGSPYILGQKVNPAYYAPGASSRVQPRLAGTYNITPTPTASGTCLFLDNPTSISIEIIPPCSAGTVEGVSKYLGYVTNFLENSFNTRTWYIEIIDRNTMLANESDANPDYTDGVYNQVERLQILLKK